MSKAPALRSCVSLRASFSAEKPYTLLGSVHSLHELRYEYDHRLGGQEHWRPDRITDSLLQYSKHSLEALNLIGEMRDVGVSIYDGIDPQYPSFLIKIAVLLTGYVIHDSYVGSLEDFNVLKTMTFGNMMFMSHDKKALDASALEDKMVKTHALVDILPASAEKLKTQQWLRDQTSSLSI